eukprot:XP_001703316.1 predicted protein [Chlamydomonas reinhardtii]
MRSFTVLLTVLSALLAGTHAVPHKRGLPPPLLRTRLPPPSAARQRSPPPLPASQRPPRPLRSPSPPPRPSPPPVSRWKQLSITVQAQVSLSAYDERLSAGLFRRGSVGTILRLVPTMLSSDPTNDITVGSASLRVQLPEEVGRGQTALLTGDIVEATLVITVPEALAQKLSSLLLINATSHASEAVDIHDLLTALTKANEGKPQPLLPPLIESNQTVPQIPLVTRIARVMAATAKGGCKCLIPLPGKGPLNVSSLTFLFNTPACGHDAGFNSSADGPALMRAVANYMGVCSYSHNHPDLYAERLRFDRKTLMIAPGDGVFSLSNMGCPGNPNVDGVVSDCLNWVSPSEPSSPVADAAALIRSHLINSGYISPGASRLVCDDGPGDGSSSSSNCRTQLLGDPSDPMGAAEPVNAAGGVVCPAAPQSYTSGWARPLRQLQADDVQLGLGFTEYEVPSMHTAEANFLRVSIDQAGVGSAAGNRLWPERAVFLSYRVASQTPGGYDSGLPANLSGRVWVHEYNQTANGLPVDPNAPPVLLASLEVEGAALVLPNAFGAGDSLHIRFVRRSDTAAAVGLCRTTVRVEGSPDNLETCFNGYDDDCDGLVDDMDPDCQ